MVEVVGHVNARACLDAGCALEEGLVGPTVGAIYAISSTRSSAGVAERMA